jgi:hypothetical protein
MGTRPCEEGDATLEKEEKEEGSEEGSSSTGHLHL